MCIGDLVTFIDWESSGGFTAPVKHVGIIVDIPESRCIPPLIDILLLGEIITAHTDEVEYVKS